MATSMRHRSAAQVKNSHQNAFNSPEDDTYKAKRETLLSFIPWMVILLFAGSTMYFIHIRSNTFPTPKTIQGARPGEFVEERARKYLDDITSFGPREVGSDANEIHVVDYLMKKLKDIKGRTSAAHTLDIDVQLTSGSFTLKFLGEFSSVYENVKNVIVKLGPKQGAKDSLLVNCHYDTVLDSPGIN